MGHAGNGVHENYGATYKGRALLRERSGGIDRSRRQRVRISETSTPINYTPAERVIAKPKGEDSDRTPERAIT